MKIKYQERGYGNMSGSSLIRQIQNEHTPNLDLLIRESIQNSLDAAKPDTPYVNIAIQTGLFDSEKLSPHFEQITDQLNTTFPGEQEFLAIRDSGTTGLTGPVSLADIQGTEYGNLHKLVYQIAKPQSKEGAGGSWGIGKTVYFRIGNGLVIYYSRIFNEETHCFEERMAASAVEDETHTVLLKNNPAPTGIAWWGEEDSKLPGKDGTIPLIDDTEIDEVLKVFQIEPFSGKQTGTIIIIPYINAKKLLRETRSVSEENDLKMTPYWKKDLVQFMKVGIQKWYCPRLDNESFVGPFLSASVNGERIQKSDFLPLFSLIQDLYNSSPENPGKFDGRTIQSEDITLKNVFDTKINRSIAGTLSHLNVTETDMLMGIPDNLPSPYITIDRDDLPEEGQHEPILASTRKPGMVVSYETASDWTHGSTTSESGEYIVGIFKSNSDVKLSPKMTTKELTTLEDYLRKGEAADHLGWSDININSQQGRIVSRIKQNIKNRFKSFYSASGVTKTQNKNISLGKKLGEKLLPLEGLGYWDSRVGGGSGPGGTGGNSELPGTQGGENGGGKSTGLRIEQTGNPIFRDNQVLLPVRMSFGKERSAILEILLKRDGGKMTAEKWWDQAGTGLPVWLNYLTINQLGKSKNTGRKKKKKQEPDLNFCVQFDQNEKWVQDIHFEVIKRNHDRKAVRIRISVPSEEFFYINGFISYTVNGFEGILDFHKDKTEK